MKKADIKDVDRAKALLWWNNLELEDKYAALSVYNVFYQRGWTLDMLSGSTSAICRIYKMFNDGNNASI